MDKIKPYNPNQKGGGDKLFTILIIGAVAYFGFRIYQSNKEKLDAIKKVV